MRIVRTVAALRDVVRAWRSEGHRVGLVTTMGALHPGHMRLVEVAAQAQDRVVGTIFVNPTQFGTGEDLGAYPRDEAGDVARFAEAGAALVFAPDVTEMYPDGFATRVQVEGLTSVLDGEARPGHFDGVAQVVTKLLNQAQADAAYFGEKDWQQLAVIRRLARDLDIPTAIEGVPTVRADDGLALSSRNAYLSADERAVAPTLFAALTAAAAEISDGAEADAACARAIAALRAAGFGPVDYVALHDAQSLVPLARLGDGPARVFGAARLGRARLIDNVPVGA